jgi:ubiquinone/menaquinone biosynthesis C-methylase UbiE
MNPIDSKGITFWDTSYKNAGAGGLWGPAHVPYMEKVTARLAAHGVTRLLDIPCGEGRNLFYLARHTPIVVGLDSSPTALSTVHERLTRQKINNCVLLEGNIFKMPFTDNQFDAVFCWDVLGHLKNADVAIRELLRVCRQGGLLIGSMFAMSDSNRGIKMACIGDEEYLYGTDCFFKFYSEAAVRELLRPFAAANVDVELAVWTEDPHPGYREYPHEHQSWCFVITK